MSDHLDAPSSADLTLGQRIRRLRTEMHLTQNQLADGDCTNGYISAIEKGRVKTPRPELLKRLAHRLGVSATALQGELGEGKFGTYAELSAKLEYDQVHAKMLAAGRDAARGRAELEEIQRRMGARAPRSLAWFAAYAACQEGDTEVALREAEAYLSEAEAERDDQGRAEAHWLFGLIYARRNDIVKAVAEYQRVLEMEDRAYFDLDAAMTIRGELSHLLLLLGDVSGCVALDQEALNEYERFADPASRVRRAYALAEDTASTGHWLKAYRFIRWAWLGQREEAARHVAAQSYLRIALARSHSDGALPEHELRQALALVGQASDGRTRLLVAALLALTLAEHHDGVAARQIISAHVRADIEDPPPDTTPGDKTTREIALGVLLLARAWMSHVDGDTVDAQALAQQAENVLRQAPQELRFCASAAYASLARLYEAMDDTKAALSALWQALSLRSPGSGGSGSDC